MNIAIDISPLKNGHYLQHRVRGTGFYLQNLKSSLEKYYPENKYVYFNRGDSLDEDIDVVHYPYFEPFFLTLPVFSKNGLKKRKCNRYRFGIFKKRCYQIYWYQFRKNQSCVFGCRGRV